MYLFVYTYLCAYVFLFFYTSKNVEVRNSQQDMSRKKSRNTCRPKVQLEALVHLGSDPGDQGACWDLQPVLTQRTENGNPSEISNKKST